MTRKEWKDAHRAARCGRSKTLREYLAGSHHRPIDPFGPESTIHLWINGYRVRTMPPGRYDFKLRDCRVYGYMKWLWDLEVIGFETSGSC